MSSLIRPKKEEIFLSKLNKKVYCGVMSLSDEEYLLSRWSLEEINAKRAGLEILLTIFWLIMDDESKRMIRDVKLVKWTDLKEDQLAFDSPVDKLKHIISGIEELNEISNAIQSCAKKSRPDKDEDEKKSLAEGPQSQTQPSLK